MHSIKQVDGAPPNGRRVGPRLESRGRRNRFQSHPLEVPHRARHVRGRRHPEETLAIREHRPHRVGLLRGIDRGVRARDPRRVPPPPVHSPAPPAGGWHPGLRR